MPSVTLLGSAQDGGVPQAGCDCSRCIDVHEGRSPELFPVSIGLIDEDGKFHLVEASRTLPRQLHIWAKAHADKGLKIVNKIESVSLTHLHLGHIDGLGQFGREVMGRYKDVRLLGSKPLIDELNKKSYLDPFCPEVVKDGDCVQLGKGLSLSFHRVPHRDYEIGETHGIVVRGPKRNILFLPDHDTWEETLALHNMKTIRDWFKELKVDIALIDGSSFTIDEVACRRVDAKSIPHPPVSVSLDLLGQREESEDPEIYFIHLNHTNPILDDPEKTRHIEAKGWHVGEQGTVWDI